MKICLLIKLLESSNHSLLELDIIAKPHISFFSLVEAFASVVQIYTFLFQSIQILLFKSKRNLFTLLQLENLYTIYSFLYFILGRHNLFEAKDCDLFFLHFIKTFIVHVYTSKVMPSKQQYNFIKLIRTLQ